MLFSLFTEWEGLGCSRLGLHSPWDSLIIQSAITFITCEQLLIAKVSGCNWHLIDYTRIMYALPVSWLLFVPTFWKNVLVLCSLWPAWRDKLSDSPGTLCLTLELCYLSLIPMTQHKAATNTLIARCIHSTRAMKLDLITALICTWPSRVVT